jgi:ankyrin repeat protein
MKDIFYHHGRRSRGMSEVYLINTLIAAFVLAKNMNPINRLSNPSSRAPVHIIFLHMSSTPSATSPPLRQMTLLLRAHLPHALADIAEGYLLPKDMRSAWSIVETGHYELCMAINDVDSGLACACAHEYVGIVQLMIDKGASVWDWGLLNACRNGHMNIVKLMIDKGASDWNDGLSSACYNGHTDIIQLMIDKGASDWNRGLSRACHNGHTNIVQLMIAKGATTCSTCDNAKHSFSH